MKGYNPGSAELGLGSTGAGKGDADRSPGWRDNYDEIGWPVVILDNGSTHKLIDEAFKRSGNKLIKKYGNTAN